MILRIFAALLLTAAGGAAGLALSERLSERKRRCSAIGTLFQRTSFYISCRMDVFTICSRLKKEDDLKMLGFIGSLPEKYEPGCDFRKRWQTAVNRDKTIAEEERELLLRLGGILGKSDCEAQIEAICALQRELERLTKMRGDELLKKGRLYRTAGLLFGVMAGIIII